MNKYVAMGIGAAVGCGVGYVIGYLVAEQISKREEQNDIEENVPEQEEEPSNEEEDESSSKHPPQKRREREIVTGPRHTINYNDIFDANNKPELAALAAKYAGVDNEPPKITVSTIKKEEVKDPQAPHVITEKEFEEALENYRYLVLTYYATDDVLVAPNDVPIADVDLVVGTDALNSFGVDPEQDGDVVYVINRKLGGIYQINRLDEAFAMPDEEVIHKNIFRDREEN